MDARLRAGLAFAASGCLTLASGVGSLEPTYTLSNGRQTNSWAIAQASKLRVIDKSPNYGWLKIVASAGATAGFILAFALIERAEDEHQINQATKAVLIEAGVEQQRLLSQADVEAMKPVVEANAIAKSQQEMAKASVKGETALPVHTKHVSEVKPLNLETAQLPNFPKQIGELGKSVMIVGVGGAGKGMFVSHAGRAYRQAKPNALIWVIDLKDDPKELNYWEGWPNQRFAKNIDTFRDPDHLLDWVETIVYRFRDTPHDGPKLLIWDEFLSGSKRSKIANAKRHKYLVSYLESISSNGDSREISFWGIGQIANAEDYGFSGGTRSMFIPIAIVYDGNKAASEQLLGTQFAPTKDKDTVLKMMDYSPVGRAIYFGPEGQWYPVPEWHNYSGYNRDLRQAA